MKDAFYSKIAGEFGFSVRQVKATAELLSEGATVPFIARYRKEATGTLDEVAVTLWGQFNRPYSIQAAFLETVTS